MSVCGMTITTVDEELACTLDASHLDADDPSMTHQSADGTVWSCFFDKH